MTRFTILENCPQLLITNCHCNNRKPTREVDEGFSEIAAIQDFVAAVDFGVSLFQQRRPEFVLVLGMDEDELSIHRRKTIVDYCRGEEGKLNYIYYIDYIGCIDCS